ncbi:MAG TPA: 50S ribosomal protein L28 [Bacteroidetes bacterium]|jgi:large subunit ribosomal protein L28|nr:50S ribosomal protein L28 [Bacteroidota bacterium]
MSKRCEVSEVGPMTGHNVSHANNRTPRRFLPNLQDKRIWVQELKRYVNVKLTSKALKTVTKNGTAEIAKLVRAGKI